MMTVPVTAKNKTLARIAALMLGSMLLLAANVVLAQDSEDDVEFLSLAALLIGDGNYERAQQVLAGVDLNDEEIDLIRYHTLAGLVALNLNELPLAVSEFQAAIAAGQTESVVWLYLAQAHFGQEQYAETLNALDQAGEQATQLPSVYMMRSQAHWDMSEYENAWQVLGQGRRQFPDRAGDFARRQVFLLVDQGLYQEAAEQGRLFLETQQASAQDAIAIGNALRQSQQFDEAARILEMARLEAPENTTLAQVLSHTYLDQDMLLPAANVMHQASMYDEELVAEAAELYRRAGWLMQALSLNAQVIDQSRKLKQRLAIFVEMGRFDQAAGMHDDLTRVGLLQDEDIRYALAFAYFRIGDFESAESQLVQLTRADLFRKATELRRVMEQCAEEPWLCT